MPICNEISDNVNAVSVDQCISELIAISLSARATAIAVRFNASEGKIQVIDNGFGITKSSLQKFEENFHNAEVKNETSKSYILEKIARNCRSLIITTRTRLSLNTYVQVFGDGISPKLMKGVHRPSQGTTISIRGFSVPIDESTEHLIHFAVVGFALFHTKVSFSLRDDLERDIRIRIGRPHDPLKIVEYICDQKVTEKNTWYLTTETKFSHFLEGYVGFIPECNDDVSCIFVNNRRVECSKIKEIINQVASKVQKLPLWRKFFEEKVFFFFNIKCCPEDYTVVPFNNNVNVEFSNQTIVSSLIYSLKKAVIKICIKFKSTNDLNIMKEFFTEKESCRGYKGEKRPEISFVKKLSKDAIIKIEKIQKDVQNQEAKATTNYAFCKTEGSYLPNVEKLGSKTFSSPMELADAKNKFSKADENKKENSTEIHEELSDITSSENVSDYFLDESESVTNSSYTYTSHESSGSPASSAFMQARSVNKDLKMSPLSEWSSWSYHSASNSRKIVYSKDFPAAQETNRFTGFRRYWFLPLTLHNLLIRGPEKIIPNKLPTNDDEHEGYKENPRNLNMLSTRYQDLTVRKCDVTKSRYEFKLNKESLYNMKVLNQINHEFIAAITIQENRVLLVLIDQHAVDERIRYEHLLEKYRLKGKKDEYVFESLNIPMKIDDLDQNVCELLMSNRSVLEKFGVFYEMENESTLLVTRVPKCFSRSKYWDDDSRLIAFTRKLLLEVTESLTNTKTMMILPSSIHHAIATEACRGAIKFGNPLTIEQCEVLLESLQDTQGPTRCAHGRPSIVPLLDVTNLHAHSKAQIKEKLNFASLRNRQLKRC